MSKASAIVLFVVAGLVGGCGKKGDPLPPIVRVPVAPADFSAERRAATVSLQFTVPATNSDGTRPANIQRVDVYAFTGPPTVADADLLRLGTRIASVEVKGPRDPDDVVDADEPNANLEPLQGSGLDQGVMARVRETVSGMVPAAAPPADATRRQYLAVGITTRGKPGLFSKRVAIPLVVPPPTPLKPDVAYDETAVRITWMPGASDGNPPSTDPMVHHVYEVAQPSSSAASGPERERRLTSSPVNEARFVDNRIEWDVERCYAVSSIRTFEDGLTAESELSPLACVKMSDTFAPAAPVGLTPVSSAGTINLTWDRNTEKDLAGYLVLRGAAPGDAMSAITPKPIEETSFKDSVQTGVRYHYSVQAVDKAGNVSLPSARVDAAAP